jgi:hypothetical protein
MEDASGEGLAYHTRAYIEGDALDTPWEVIDRCTLRWSTTR